MHPPPSQTSDHEMRITLFAFAGHALNHVYMILFAPLLVPMQREFGLDVDGITFYFFLANVFFGLGAVPAGWLCDKLGAKPLLVVFFLGSAIGGAMVGLAESRILLGAGAVTLGLAGSIFHPVSNALIARSARRPGRAMGLNGIGGSLGVGLGPAYASLVAVHASWRWAFLLLAAPSVLLGLWLWVSDLGPAAAPHPRSRLASSFGPPFGPSFGSPSGSRPLPAGIAGGDRGRSGLIFFLGCMIAAMTCAGFNYQLVTTMLPQVLSATPLDIGDMEKSGIKAGIALTFGIVGQFLAGFLAERFENRRLYLTTLALVAPAVFLLGHLTGTPLLAAACGASILIFALQPIENTLLARFSPPEWKGAVYGAKFIFAFGLGGTGTWAAGLIVKHYAPGGLPRVFEAAAGSIALALILAFLAGRNPIRGPAPPAQPSAPPAQPPAPPAQPPAPRRDG